MQRAWTSCKGVSVQAVSLDFACVVGIYPHCDCVKQAQCLFRKASILRANLKQLLVEQQEVELPASPPKLAVGDVVPGNKAIRQSQSTAQSSHSSVSATRLCYVTSDSQF
jgi:hypothetical protein